jgi:hypothetical protein
MKCYIRTMCLLLALLLLCACSVDVVDDGGGWHNPGCMGHRECANGSSSNAGWLRRYAYMPLTSLYPYIKLAK